MATELAGLFGLSIFSIVFFGSLLLGLIELVGKIYATYSSLSREDLSGEQRLVYLAVIWFVPLGWLIYLLLGKERTSDLFSELDFL